MAPPVSPAAARCGGDSDNIRLTESLVHAGRCSRPSSQPRRCCRDSRPTTLTPAAAWSCAASSPIRTRRSRCTRATSTCRRGSIPLGATPSSTSCTESAATRASTSLRSPWRATRTRRSNRARSSRSSPSFRRRRTWTTAVSGPVPGGLRRPHRGLARRASPERSLLPSGASSLGSRPEASEHSTSVFGTRRSSAASRPGAVTSTR